MDDVDITLLRHVAGDYDAVLGQLCMRCGMVLDEGGRALPSPAPGLRALATSGGFTPGEAVLASVPTGSLRMLESAMRADRDRSDEADCASIIDPRST